MDTISYERAERFLVPKLQMEEKMDYGKYGQMRLDYLKKHRQDKYMYFLMEGTLNNHLAQVDMKGKEMVDRYMIMLQKAYPMPDQKDILTQAGHLNNLKQMAEELMYPTLIYI